MCAKSNINCTLHVRARTSGAVVVSPGLIVHNSFIYSFMHYLSSPMPLPYGRAGEHAEDTVERGRITSGNDLLADILTITPTAGGASR